MNSQASSTLVLPDTELVTDVAEMPIRQRLEMVGDQRLGDRRDVMAVSRRWASCMSRVSTNDRELRSRWAPYRASLNAPAPPPRRCCRSRAAISSSVSGQEAVLVQLPDDPLHDIVQVAGEERPEVPVRCSCERERGFRAGDRVDRRRGSVAGGSGAWLEASRSRSGPPCAASSSDRLPPQVGPPQVGQIALSRSARAPGSRRAPRRSPAAAPPSSSRRMWFATICLGVTLACMVGSS